MHWWTRGQRVPPLATTSDPGTPLASAGILGTGTTSLLLGDERLNAQGAPGGRFWLGWNIDDTGSNRLEFQYFLLGQETESFLFSSPAEFGILARPYFDTFTNQPSAQVIGFPASANGQVNVGTELNLHGLGMWWRTNLLSLGPWQGDFVGWPGRRGHVLNRVDLILGYRNLDLDESLNITSQQVVTDPGGTLPAGSVVHISDRFRTENDFDGFDVGLGWHWSKGRFGTVNAIRFAVGNLRQSVTILGNTSTTLPGGSPTRVDGGLLALPSNIGTYQQSDFAIVPELGLNLYWQISACSRMTFGYTVIALPDAVRPGDQVDFDIDSRQIPPGTYPAARAPEQTFVEDDLWVRGLNWGVEFAF